MYLLFDVYLFVGVVVFVGVVLMVVFVVVGYVIDFVYCGIYVVFGVVWFVIIVVVVFGNYLMFVVGYGGSVIIGYVVSFMSLFKFVRIYV